MKTFLAILLFSLSVNAKSPISPVVQSKLTRVVNVSCDDRTSIALYNSHENVAAPSAPKANWKSTYTDMIELNYIAPSGQAMVVQRILNGFKITSTNNSGETDVSDILADDVLDGTIIEVIDGHSPLSEMKSFKITLYPSTKKAGQSTFKATCEVDATIDGGVVNIKASNKQSANAYFRFVSVAKVSKEISNTSKTISAHDIKDADVSANK